MTRSHQNLASPVLLNGDNIKYILSAEFDNKLGAVLKYQYPKSIPGFKPHLQSARTTNGYQSSNLANLMIPDNVERIPNKPDFTVFILYKNSLTQTYDLFPSKILNNDSRSIARGEANNSILFEKDEMEANSNEMLDNYQDEDLSSDDTLFFLNVVNTIIDESNERGAKIQSIAIGTTMRSFIIFKPIIVMTLHYYMTYPKVDRLQLLIDCFNMLNSLDLSMLKKVFSKARLQNILQSVTDSDAIDQIFNDDKINSSRILKWNLNGNSDLFGNKFVTKKQMLTQYFSIFKPVIFPEFMSQIPIQIDLIRYQSISLSLNYNNKILKFLSFLIPEINKLDKNYFSRKLVINSTTSSKDTIAQFVLSLSNLMGGYNNGSASKYYKGHPILFFPYMDISMIDALRSHIEPESDFAQSFVIIGTANPIFKFQPDIWDFYYDLDEEMLYSSGQTGKEKLTLKQELKNGTSSFKKLLVKPHNSNFGSSPRNIDADSNDIHNPNRTGLTLKFIQYLQDGLHDNETVLNVFRRIFILQLIALLPSKDEPNMTNVKASHALSLQDEYISTYRDLILFPQYFDISSVQIIDHLSILVHSLDNLKNINIKNTTNEMIYSKVSIIYDIYKEFYTMVCANKPNLDKFISILLNFPSLQLTTTFNLKTQDFAILDLEGIFKANMDKNGKSSSKETDSFIDNFIRTNCFEYLASFLSFSLNETGSIFSPELHLSYKSQVTRSRSLKDIFNLSQLSNSNTHTITSSPSTSPRKRGSITNASMITKTSSILLEKKILKVKRVITKLLVKIQRHPIGNILLDTYLSERSRKIFVSLRPTVVHSNSIVFERPPQIGQTRGSKSTGSLGQFSELPQGISGISREHDISYRQMQPDYDESTDLSVEIDQSSLIINNDNIVNDANEDIEEIFYDAQ